MLLPHIFMMFSTQSTTLPEVANLARPLPDLPLGGAMLPARGYLLKMHGGEGWFKRAT